jgi:hypothetical protein
MAESTWDGILLVLGEARTPRRLPPGPPQQPPIHMSFQDMISADTENTETGRIRRFSERGEFRCQPPE